VTIVWSAQARDDLKAIQAFIARDSELYALRVIEAIITRVEEIAEMPTRGHPVHEHPEPGLREIHAVSYRIIYKYDDDSVSVVTVVHMKQILPRKRLR
jgi:toxin ParE1/3/4